MKVTNFTIALIVCVLNTSVRAQNGSTSPKKKYIADTRFFMLVDVRSSFQFKSASIQKAEFFMRPEMEMPFSKNLRLKAIGRVYGEMLDNLEPGKPSQDAVSDFSKRIIIGDHFEAELREFYLDWRLGKHYLTVGKQQIVWGKSDGLKILDIVNPTNLREFLFDDFDNSRIPLWAIKADLKLSKVNAQLIWVPDITYHDFPPQSGTFFPRALFSTPPQGFSIINNPVEKSKKPIKDGDYGIRLSAFLNGWDVTLNYLYQYDDFSVTKTSFDTINHEIIVNPIFKRYHLLGATFSNAFGSFTLRGELGYSRDKYFSSANSNVSEGIFKSDQINSVIGIEYSGIRNTTVSLQLFEDYIFENQKIIGRERLETNATFLINRRFANELLTAYIICVQNLNKHDGFAKFKVNYRALSNLTVFIGTDLFYGDSERLFGQFKPYNRISMGLQLGI